MPLSKSWHEYNESLIERGRILMDISFLRSSIREIKNMNKGKVGAPFEYSRTYIQFLAFLKTGFKISYRIVQGAVRGLSDYSKHVEHKRQQYNQRRSSLQEVGTKSAKRKLKKLSGRERRFKKDTNHVISKMIVSKAKGTYINL